MVEKIYRREYEAEICPKCFGCGMSDTDGRGRRPCDCRKHKLRQIIVNRIPERNRRAGVPNLATLAPLVPREHHDQPPEVRDKIIGWQTKLIDYVRSEPYESLNLCGKNKIGKSQIGYALYMNAFENNRQARCFKMAELLADYQKSAQQSFQNVPAEESYKTRFTPRLTTDELAAQNPKYTVLIDEFHNVIPSFTTAQMRTAFEILDAIKAGGHQLILLSNFPFEWLGKAMHSKKKALGEEVGFIADAIISRINEDAVTEELFWDENSIR